MSVRSPIRSRTVAPATGHSLTVGVGAGAGIRCAFVYAGRIVAIASGSDLPDGSNVAAASSTLVASVARTTAGTLLKIAAELLHQVSSPKLKLQQKQQQKQKTNPQSIQIDMVRLLPCIQKTSIDI